ncbi:type II secretion system protein [Fervidibacillus halotolerans]|uniref:Type II secretion system GspH family protein n=1 Tax=Fervidibacillus halotolerans TaxID=2980027 RepID=A0A9E8RYH3_9BACI|nr:type II secretion system protein [Fervidibacillus halotolerans]WAA12841.1 type II secretion system GspH family protein [Fervidibacillus halotolerans]
MNKLKKRLKNEKGMTLVELLAVLVILGIIAAIAVPMIGNIINDSKDKAILADAQMILSGAKLAYANGEGTPDSTESNKITFQKDTLKNYVDGIDSNATYSVTYDSSSNEWTVSYSELGNLKDNKYDEIKNEEKITSTQISKYLKGEDDTSTPPENNE